VRDATVEQIAALPGFSASSARKLLDSLGVPRDTARVDLDTADAAGQPNDAVPIDQNAPAGNQFPRTPDTP